MERIADVASQYPDIKAPNRLIERIFDTIRGEFRIPNATSYCPQDDVAPYNG